jgi:hypothetical protein
MKQNFKIVCTLCMFCLKFNFSGTKIPVWEVGSNGWGWSWKVKNHKIKVIILFVYISIFLLIKVKISLMEDHFTKWEKQEGEWRSRGLWVYIKGSAIKWAKKKYGNISYNVVHWQKKYPWHFLNVSLFSPWYSWKIAELALNNNHSLSSSIKQFF